MTTVTVGMPRGFSLGHPAARYLQMKGYGLKTPMTDLQVQKADTIDHLVDQFKAARPVAIGISAGSCEERDWNVKVPPCALRLITTRPDVKVRGVGDFE
jgi:hypothetical protein